MKVAVIAIVLCAVGSAHAENRTKLFPLSSSGLPKPMKSTPGELTRVLSRSLGAETTTVPIEDAAELMECSLTDRSCLEAIAKSVGVKTIVFGRLELRRGGAVVKVTTFDLGKGDSQRTITLTGETSDDLSESLRDALDGKEEPPPTRTRVIDTPSPTPAATSTGPTTGTWALIIGGAITTGAGIALRVSANGLAARAAAAPDDTLLDLQRLAAIEKAGAARTNIGYGLIGVGAVVTTIGVIRMVMQKRAVRPEEPRLDLVPESGGASVLFTMGWQ